MYHINDSVLEVVSSYKYLGFVISSDLSWSKHVDMTVTKASRVLDLITRISGGHNLFPIVEMFFFTFV